MTKEAILTDKYQRETGMFLAEKGWYKWQLDAMDEYAKQQAIAFARWITSDTPEWRKGVPHSKIITNNDLYDLFIEQQNKDNDK